MKRIFQIMATICGFTALFSFSREVSTGKGRYIEETLMGVCGVMAFAAMAEYEHLKKRYDNLKDRHTKLKDKMPDYLIHSEDRFIDDLLYKED